MPRLNGVPKSYEEAARTLAGWHATELQTAMTVYLFPDPGQDTVRLVEVSDEFPAFGDARPVVFGRSTDFPFRSEVIQVTSAEWAEIEHGRMTLPTGWDRAARRRIPIND